ncbi:MAG: FtsX-like permease family protein [Lachnospiraceae bacterium]|nr:FtsX-like permease family protein [Lachnospiraceae bacterium]
MKLNKRYVRGIRDNLSFYIAASVLTMVTLVLFFLFNIAGNAILNFSEDFFPAHKLEDAHFSTYMPIPDEEIDKLAEEYNLTLEAQRYVNIETDGVTVRVFERTEQVDLYEITAGEDASANNEIIISEGYAQNKGVEMGNSLKIGDKSYTVTGCFQRPDYLYMLENTDDSYKNITTFYLAYMTDEAFAKLGETSCQYLVIYHEDNSTAFRKAVHESYYMQHYSSAEENLRITMVDTQAQMFVIMAYIILCVLPLIAVALVCIIIGRKIKSEQKLIGTLSALGYKKGILMRHYAGFAAIPGVAGGILCAAAAYLFAQPYSELGLQDYEPMRVTGSLKPFDALLGILVPTALYVIAALLSVGRLLKKDTILLLSGNADADKQGGRRIFAGNKMSFRLKYAVRQVLGSPARSFVVILGVFLGCFIMLFSFGIFDSIENTADVSSENAGSYEYQYVLSELTAENPYGGAEMLVFSMENENGGAVTLIGTDEDNPYLNFRDRDGNNVNIQNGYYITSLAAMLNDWDEGDEIKLYNPLTLEKHEIVIAGVLQNDAQRAVYTTEERAAELSGLETGMHNALISDTALGISSDKVAQESSKSALREQVQTMKTQMGFMVYLLIAIGVIICIASVYVAVNMLVTENRANISMLKVLGYRDKQIDRIVLSVNHIFLPIGILLSIPAAHVVGSYFFRMFADYAGILVTVWISPLNYVLAVTLTAVCYAASLLLVRRKVKKVDMIESLKDNRE